MNPRKQGKTDVPAYAVRKELAGPGSGAWIPPFSVLCSIQDLSRLNAAHTHCGGESALLSSPSQMLISPRNILQVLPETMFSLGHLMAHSSRPVIKTIAGSFFRFYFPSPIHLLLLTLKF